jgi:hypothetical protein
VTEAEQAAITRRAELERRSRQVRAWRSARKAILAGVAEAEAVVDRRLVHDLRPIRRVCDKISRELGA